MLMHAGVYLVMSGGRKRQVGRRGLGFLNINADEWALQLMRRAIQVYWSHLKMRLVRQPILAFEVNRQLRLE